MHQSAHQQLSDDESLRSNMSLPRLDKSIDPEVMISRLEERCARLVAEREEAELVAADAQDRFDHLNRAIYILGRDIFSPEESLCTNASDKIFADGNDDVSAKSFMEMASSLEGLGVCNENMACPQSPTPSHISLLSLVSLSTDDALSIGRLDVTDSNFEMLSNACYMLKERLRLTAMEADSVVDDVNAANNTVQNTQSKMEKMTRMLKVLWNESFQYQRELKKVKKERSVLVKKVKALLLIVNEQENQISNAGIVSLLPKNFDKPINRPSSKNSRLKMQLDLVKSVELHEKLLKGIVLKKKSSGKLQLPVSPDVSDNETEGPSSEESEGEKFGVAKGNESCHFESKERVNQDKENDNERIKKTEGNESIPHDGVETLKKKNRR